LVILVWLAAAYNPSCSAQQALIPRGTILPVVLRTTMSPDKMKQGQLVHGQIAQDVPLPGGSKIRRGSKVQGEVLGVADSNNRAAEISLRFDKVYLGGQTVAITTDLRAIAGFMTVLEAYSPDRVPGEGDVARWETTTQIGGDSVYGEGGPVMSAENATERVGTSVPNGVLVRLSAKPGSPCRGALDNNDTPQALWVFSSDACGVYGLANVSISHAGRTNPVGTITLQFQNPKTKIRPGAGLLLRIVG
jgi:hypothetical protein